MRASLERKNRLDERPPEKVADAYRDEQGKADDVHQLPRQDVRHGVGFAARLLDHHRPAQQLERRGDAEHLGARVTGVLERSRRGVALAMHEADERLGGEIVAPRHTRLLVGVAMGDQLTVGGDDEGIALIADANLIDHPPHFFKADLADERSRVLPELGQLDAHDGCRQEIVVDADGRERDVRAEARAGLRELHLRAPHAARRELAACRVVECDLTKLGKIEHRSSSECDLAASCARFVSARFPATD